MSLHLIVSMRHFIIVTTRRFVGKWQRVTLAALASGASDLRVVPFPPGCHYFSPLVFITWASSAP